jgi:transcription initiation factor IIF auxiliary subunit
MVSEQLAVEMRDSVFDPELGPDQKAQVRRQKGKKPLYRVFLYLEGSDLPYVSQVTYYLHSTFSDPVRTISRTVANPRCKLEIWTWGLFRVRAVVVDKKGQSYTMYHDLSYDQAFDSGQITFAEI